jgi:hypothetical protein
VLHIDWTVEIAPELQRSVLPFPDDREVDTEPDREIHAAPAPPRRVPSEQATAA